MRSTRATTRSATRPTPATPGPTKAIVMISSEMEEILGMSDRIIVLHEGMIAGELKKEQFSQENVLTLASGMEVSA